MATITTLANPVSGNKPVRYLDNNVLDYVIWRDIDLAAAVTAKGSALAAADVIEGLRVPANTAIVDVWAQKIGVMTGTSTDLTFDIGITGVDADQWVDGWDFDAAAAGSFATPLGVAQSRPLATSDTIDILIATQTGTLLTGKVRLFASCVDLNVKDRGNIAQPKS
jgi:hypothetical protein